MLTKTDINQLKTIFVTKGEFKEEIKLLREEFITRFDAVMFELKAMREEMSAMLYRQREHSNQLENHEERLAEVETKLDFPQPS